jgi:hypothetical protein
MLRRDFVKAVAAASVTAKTVFSQQAKPPIAPGPVPWTQGLDAAKPLPVSPLVPDAAADTAAPFFTAVQMATLRRLCEILMPARKSYPGALESGTPEFLDFLIGASPADRRQMYRSGLDRLHAEAKQRFGVAFAAVSAEQADRLIRPWLRTEPYAQFINVSHSDIRHATVNSQAWTEADTEARRQAPALELYWFPVEPDLRRRAAAAMRSAAPKPKHA